MTFFNLIEAIISKSSRMLQCWVLLNVFQGSFMTPILIKFCTFHSLRPNLKHATHVWSPHESFKAALIECNTISIAVESVVFARLLCTIPSIRSREGLCSRIDCVNLALLLRFENVPLFNVVTGLFLWCGGLRYVPRSIEVCSAGGVLWSIYYNISWRGSGDFFIWIVSFNPVDQAILLLFLIELENYLCWY
jgi:hypothetical protein